MIILFNDNYKVAIEKIKKEKSIETSLFFINLEKENIKNLKRKYEKYYTHKLLNYLLKNTKYTVKYNNRKPIIKNKALNISISHTNGRVGVALSQNQLGLDMEVISIRTQKLLHRFINEKDKNFINADNIVDTTLLWTIKEATFKLDNSLINFKRDIYVTNIMRQNKFKGQVEILHKISADYYIFDNFIVTVAFRI